MSDEYSKMQEAIRKSNRNKKKYNYREANVKCCATCRHSSQMSIEDSIRCKIINPNENWDVEFIDELYICDKYESCG